MYMYLAFSRLSQIRTEFSCLAHDGTVLRRLGEALCRSLQQQERTWPGRSLVAAGYTVDLIGGDYPENGAEDGATRKSRASSHPLQTRSLLLPSCSGVKGPVPRTRRRFQHRLVRNIPSTKTSGVSRNGSWAAQSRTYKIHRPFS